MKSIAVISDVHANAQALVAVLRKIDAMDIEDVFCLGDFASGGPYPEVCYELVTRRCSVILAGNHELFVTGHVWEASDSDWARFARAAYRELGPERVDFLAGLSSQVDGSYMQLVHASLRDPVMEFIDKDTIAAKQFPKQKADYTLFGHTHKPALWAHHKGYGAERGRIARNWKDLPERALLNPGAVCDPRGPRWMELALDDSGRPEKARWHKEEIELIVD